jgi:hypothetical protein
MQQNSQANAIHLGYNQMPQSPGYVGVPLPMMRSSQHEQMKLLGQSDAIQQEARLDQTQQSPPTSQQIPCSPEHKQTHVMQTFDMIPQSPQYILVLGEVPHNVPSEVPQMQVSQSGYVHMQQAPARQPRSSGHVPIVEMHATGPAAPPFEKFPSDGSVPPQTYHDFPSSVSLPPQLYSSSRSVPSGYDQQGSRDSGQKSETTEVLQPGSEVHLRDSFENAEGRFIDEWIVSCGRTTDTFHLLKKLSLSEILKEGKLGLVARATDDGGECRYVKQVHIHRKGADRALAEVPLLRELGHPNVTAIWDVYSNARKGSEADICYVIMDPMDGDLAYLIGLPASSLSAAHCSTLVSQLLKGLRYIHDRGISHCGICPSNLLVTDACDLRIANFHFASVRPVGTTSRSSVLKGPPSATDEQGTDEKKLNQDELFTRDIWLCSAPEILCNAGEPTAGADIWSVGCVIVEMYTLLPFIGCDTRADQMRHLISLLGWPDYPALGIKEEEIMKLQKSSPDLASTLVYLESLRKKHKLSDCFKDLLSRMFRLDPNAREPCHALLNHQFLNR